jgi:riboflavin synthase
MFTGIIKKLSEVKKTTWQKGSLFVEIKIPKGWKVKAGESISVNGVCSTVKKVSKNIFTVEYMPETVKKTTTGDFQKGREVNLEKSLRINDLLDGHLIQGHVDTTGKIIEIKKVKESKVMEIQVSKEFMKFLAPKGSVSVDGISLTIVDSKKDWLVPHHNFGKLKKPKKHAKKFGAGFSVSLVSYTLENTNLGNIRVGEKVNIEIDAIAKYIFNILKSTGYAKR